MPNLKHFALASTAAWTYIRQAHDEIADEGGPTGAALDLFWATLFWATVLRLAFGIAVIWRARIAEPCRSVRDVGEASFRWPAGFGPSRLLAVISLWCSKSGLGKSGLGKSGLGKSERRISGVSEV